MSLLLFRCGSSERGGGVYRYITKSENSLVSGNVGSLVDESQSLVSGDIGAHVRGNVCCLVSGDVFANVGD